MKAIEENKIQEITGEDRDIEWEYEITKPSKTEEIKNRPREYTYGTKKETFLQAYETIFSWLCINFNPHHKEQFWKAILYDISNNQEQLYEIRLRQIMEFEVNGTKFKWCNEASRTARKKRTKNFQSSLFQDRSEKLLCDSISFMKTPKMRLKEILQGKYFGNCFTRKDGINFLHYMQWIINWRNREIKILRRPDQVKNKLIKDVLPIN
jgi:hypothetical protein